MSGHLSQFPCILPSYLVQVPVTPLYEGQGDFLSVQKETIVKRSTISFKQFNRRHSGVNPSDQTAHQVKMW